ncbi:uncharacterized protein VTP21DRAFT_1434 [Calcarisporiella thermophila]|uniref:uncharacterized protein n=1 Tax=Calcarisporiella thermophila TaxID=911321 RepID=UPI00374263CA
MMETRKRLHILVLCILFAIITWFIAHPLITLPRPKQPQDSNEEEEWIARRLGTNSPYPLGGEVAEPAKGPEGCDLVHIQIISRHGARYPSIRDINAFTRLSAVISKFTFPPQFTWLSRWNNPFPPELENRLSPRGEQDMYLLGKRVSQRYAQLLDNAGSTEVRVSSSEFARSGESAYAFSIGAFEGKGEIGFGKQRPMYIHTIPKGEDKELAMKLACPRWLAYAHTRAKDQLFHYGATLKPIASRLNSVLGSTIFDLDEIKSMYKLCGFEYATWKKRSWCDMFEKDEILLMEYANDLGHYYEYGHGNELNEHIGCQLLTSLVNDIRAVLSPPGANATEPAKAVFRFGHSETIFFLVTILGLYRDSQPLLANSTLEFIHGRLFRGALISPFAANIMLEVWRCKDKGARIRLLLNEQEIHIPGCESPWCEWETAEASWLANTGCDFTRMCQVDEMGWSEFES